MYAQGGSAVLLNSTIYMHVGTPRRCHPLRRLRYAAAYAVKRSVVYVHFIAALLSLTNT